MLDYLLGLAIAISVIGGFYYIPYLIRRGWIAGENATVREKYVCDVCFRNAKRLKEFVKDNLDNAI